MTRASTSETTPAQHPCAAPPAQHVFDVEYEAPVSVVVDLELCRVSRVIVWDGQIRPTGRVAVRGVPYRGPETATALAVAARLAWPAWRCPARSCSRCGEGADLGFDYGNERPGVDSAAPPFPEVSLAHRVPITCVVDCDNEAVIEVAVWDDALEQTPALDGHTRAARELATRIAREVMWPVWSVSRDHCRYCGVGTVYDWTTGTATRVAKPPLSPRWRFL
jgi:hypothetical protein